MSWSLEKETALRRLTATGVPYHEAMRRVETDIPAEQGKIQGDLERAQASVDHLGEVLDGGADPSYPCKGCGLDYHYENGHCARCGALAPWRER